MIQTIAKNPEYPFAWVNVTDPAKEELHEIAKKYELHDSSVEDCLQPDHLPKYENVGPYTFVILRVYSDQVAEQADTVQELIDKIVIFLKDNLIITIHREPFEQFADTETYFLKSGLCKSALHVLNEIVKMGLKSYDERAIELVRKIEHYEAKMFLKTPRVSQCEGLYYLKRKVDVTRRILLLSSEIIEKIDHHQHSDPFTRDTRDLYVKLHAIYDTLFKNTNHLLNVYFSISSQNTNDIMRVLTIFSVFFMPLTFIVGIYGMNFENMPELKMKLGYPAIWLSMVVVTGFVYTWFKRNGWL